MKERLQQARKAYERIPKYGYMKPPTPPSDFGLVRAFLAEDLAAVSQCKDTTDRKNLKRLQRHLTALQQDVEWLAAYRAPTSKAAPAEE